MLSGVFLRLDNLEQLDELQNAADDRDKPPAQWADTVGKLSKTDFLMVLPETAGDDAQKLINKLSKKPRQLFLRLLP